MKKIKFFKRVKLVAAVLIGTMSFALLMFLAPSLHQAYLLQRARTQVIKLVNPDNHDSGGTGFSMVAKSGKVFTITNGHVCAMTPLPYVDALVPSTENVYVRLKKIEYSMSTDLCILEELPGTDPLTMAKKLRMGEQVAIIGFPFLGPLTLTMGQVNAYQFINVLIATDLTEEQCKARGGQFQPIDPIVSILTGIDAYCVRSLFSARTTVQTFPGNSGSPVLDFTGRVVGVLFAGNDRTNWGFIVPLVDLQKFLEKY